MSLSTVLDVAIGLLLVYLLLALLASGFQELLAGLLQLRGRALRKSIARLLDGGAVGAAPLVDHVFGHPLVGGAAAPALPSYVPSRNVRMALLDALRGDSQLPRFSQIEVAVDRMAPGPIKSTLTTLLVDAAGDLDRLEASIERWFDDAMDRVSGSYKRLSHYCLLALGLALAVGLNVDSVRIAQTLWHDPQLRAQVVQAAQQVAQNPPPAADPNAPPSIDAAGALAGLPVPLGWPQGHVTLAGQDVAWTLLGWLVTAFAISLGAPFWFDALQRALSLRSAGARPARSVSLDALDAG